MKTMLAILRARGEVRIGDHALYTYSTGEIVIRMNNSLTSPSERATMAGLRRLLAWLDRETKQ